MPTKLEIAREWEHSQVAREELDTITRRIIGSAQRVHATLGRGFLERVYENALAVELAKDGLSVMQQAPFEVRYGEIPVGHCVVDLLVEDRVIVELKATLLLDAMHRAQCINYLKASNLRVGLLLNFGAARLEVRRYVNNF